MKSTVSAGTTEVCTYIQIAIDKKRRGNSVISNLKFVHSHFGSHTPEKSTQNAALIEHHLVYDYRVK